MAVSQIEPAEGTRELRRLLATRPPSPSSLVWLEELARHKTSYVRTLSRIKFMSCEENAQSLSHVRAISFPKETGCPIFYPVCQPTKNTSSYFSAFLLHTPNSSNASSNAVCGVTCTPYTQNRKEQKPPAVGADASNSNSWGRRQMKNL